MHENFTWIIGATMCVRAAQRNNVRLREHLFRYQQTVLRAGQEVADALVAYLQYQLQAESLVVAAKEAEDSVVLGRPRTRRGASISTASSPRRRSSSPHRTNSRRRAATSHRAQGAKSVVFFMDGGDRHPMIQGERLETMRKLMDQGVGLVCLHYAVEFPKGKVGDQILDWLGGYYETAYSDNPHNDARILPKSDHPITRGVKPFKANDEWYFKIRFRPDDPRVTTILTAEELVGHDKKSYKDQTVAWATERKDGGRSFGFTGAHFHDNWGQDDFRSLVLNAILWSAKLEVPSGGVKINVAPEELEKNLDPKPGPKPKKKAA